MRHGFVYRWWPTALTLCAVLWLTLAPDPVPDTDVPLFPGVDKLVHAIMMGGLTGAVLFDWQRAEPGKESRLSWRTVLVVALVMLVFSAVDEWAQGAMALGRSTDPLDFAADAAGIAVASLAAPPLIGRIFRKGRRK